MKKLLLTCTLMLLSLASCKDTGIDNGSVNKSDIAFTADSTLAVPVAAPEETLDVVSPECKDSETLLFQDDAISTYTEDIMRGTGVASFTLEVNDRLPIYNVNDSNFGEIVLNEDLTYYTLTMPEKVVARNVVPEHDVASFEFDAEDPGTDKKFLYIYVNKQKRKVDKSEVKYTFYTWDKYLNNSMVSLKPCNMAVDASGKAVKPKSTDAVYKVLEVKGDKIRIASEKACTPDGIPYENIQGWLKWKNGNSMIINLANCN